MISRESNANNLAASLMASVGGAEHRRALTYSTSSGNYGRSIAEEAAIIEATLNGNYNDYMNARFKNVGTNQLSIKTVNELTQVFKSQASLEATSALEVL